MGKKHYHNQRRAAQRSAPRPPKVEEQTAAGTAEAPKERYVDQDAQTVEVVCVDRGTQTDEVLAGENLEATSPTEQPEYDQQPEFESFEAAQAAREEKYIIFGQEDETDYVSGPIRIVDAFDGAETGASLLLNLELSARIQASIAAQRGLDLAEQAAEQERFQLLSLQTNINGESAMLQGRIAGCDDPESDEAKAMQREFELLQNFASQVKQKEGAIDARLQSQAERLRQLQADVNEYLEEAFVAARLVEPVGDLRPRIESMDFQEEYSKFRKAQTGEEYERPRSATPTPSDEASAPLEQSYEPSPEEQAREDTLNAFFRAQNRFAEAEYHFDHKESYRDQEEANMSETPETFYARWIQHYSEITRELIDAETEFDEAKAAILAANIDITPDDRSDRRSSCFADLPDDGYGDNWEDGAKASAPKAEIHGWLTNVPDDAGLSEESIESPPEVDEWNFEEVDISDGRTSIEEIYSKRRKLRKWQQLMGHR